MGTLTRARAADRRRTGRHGAGRRLTRPVVAAALLVVLLAFTGCSRTAFRLYEYQEDIYLSLDGSASVYVSASVPALVALRGFDLSTDPVAPIRRSTIRALYTSPVTRVVDVSLSRRSGRQFVHVHVDVADIRQLSRAAPFAWARYEFRREGDQYVYRQVLGPSADHPVGDVGWTGHEMVAFRLHVPSRITYHNAGPGHLLRGNILLWEQPLTDRIAGVPLVMDVHMDAQSILYRTLLLFGGMLVLVIALFVGLIWWMVRRGGASPAPS